MKGEIKIRQESTGMLQAALLAIQLSDERPSTLREKVAFLDRFGFETIEIALILGIKVNHAAKERSLLGGQKSE